MKKIYLVIIFFATLSCSKDKEYLYKDTPDTPISWNIKEHTITNVKAFFDKDGSINEIGNESKTITKYSREGDIIERIYFRGYLSKIDIFNGGVTIKGIKEHEARLDEYEFDEKGRQISYFSKSSNSYRRLDLKDPTEEFQYISLYLGDFYYKDTLFYENLTPNWTLNFIEVRPDIYLYTKGRFIYDETTKKATLIYSSSSDNKIYVDDSKVVYNLLNNGKIDYSGEYEVYDIEPTKVEKPISGERVVKKDERGNIILDFSYLVENGKKEMISYIVSEYEYFD